MITIRMGKVTNKLLLLIQIFCSFGKFYTKCIWYEALKGCGILQLPSRSTLQSYTGAFLHEPGASSKCISDQVAQCVLFIAECKKKDKHPPKSDGALMFDEVKVACQLMRNSSNQTLTGLAMTSKDMSLLVDVYQLLQTPQTTAQTSYILQFLWRDLTSGYDIVGLVLNQSTVSSFWHVCWRQSSYFNIMGLRQACYYVMGGFL